VPASLPIDASAGRDAPKIAVVPALVPRARGRSRSRIVLAASVVAVVLGLAFVLAYVLWPRHATNVERFHTVVLARGDVVQHDTATGCVQPRSTVEVRTPLTARIAEVSVEVDDAVVAGQLLARMEVDGADQQLAQLRAEVESAAADARRASYELERARRGYARARSRFVSGRVGAPALDAARERLSGALARRAEALARSGSRGSVLALARATIANTGVHAPVDGVVIASHVAPGRTVAAPAGAVLFVIATALDRVHVLAPIDASAVGSVAIGQRARVRVAPHPKGTFHGEVLAVRAPHEAVLVVDNRDRALLPGMTVVVDIETAAAHDVWRVLDAALEFRPPNKKPGDGDEVWVLTPRGPRRTPVVRGIGDGIATQVEGDLHDGDMVIVALTEAGREAYGTDE
jgi:RND family efflux transporter MFP subunit